MAYRTNQYKKGPKVFAIEDVIVDFQNKIALGNHDIGRNVEYICDNYRPFLSAKDSRVILKGLLDSLADEANHLFISRNAPYRVTNKVRLTNFNGFIKLNLQTRLVQKGRVFDKTLYKAVWDVQSGFRTELYSDDYHTRHITECSHIIRLKREFIADSMQKIKASIEINALKKGLLV